MTEQKSTTDKEYRASVIRGTIVIGSIVIVLIVLSVFITYRITDGRCRQLKQDFAYAIAGSEDKQVNTFKIEKPRDGESLIFIIGE